MEKVHFNQDSKTSADGENGDGDGDDDGEEEDEDYSASVSAILLRRASSKRQPSRRRRASSTLSPDGFEGLPLPRRRSSNVTTTSAETAISIEEGMTEEHIFQNIKLHKEVLSNVKQQPWPMRRKMKLVKQAKTYVKIHEGELQERLAQSKTTRDMLACCDIIFVKEWQFIKRELANLMNVMVPWELRIKEIESHFGSVVASYFTFLRWLFWVNLVISLILITFVAIPEILVADKKNAGERKELMDEEKANATNFMVLWDFEGVLKYSPIFYGYYSSRDSSKHGFGYKGPLAYFLTGIGVYIYSFVATLRRMAENSRQSKLSEKDDECVFTWKLFTGWDYMIGNSETAHNRTASIILGFKEALLEEAEKKRDERSWKMIGLRIFTNLNVLWLLGTSVCAVVFVVQRSTEKREAGGWWRQNEVTIVVSLITNLFPFIFEMLGSLEQYHPRKRLRMQLARIMVLNMLNLYTFILASFSKINDMTIELQGIKKALINASMNQPAELMAPGKHEIFIPTVTTISNNIYYDILNTTRSSATTISSCYVEKVNCTTKITTEQPPSSSTSSTSSAHSSSSMFTALTTLFLLSNITSTVLPDFNENVSYFKQDEYNLNSNDNLSVYNDSVYFDDEEPQETLFFHNEIATTNLKRSADGVAKETKHFIFPLNVELFNFGNYSDDYFLTPEDYPDENETDSNISNENNININISTTIMNVDDNNYTESSSTIFTTDDGCQYVTICPDLSSAVIDPSSSVSSTSSTIYYTEPTESTTLPPSTTTSAVSESVITQDLSIYTKNLDFQTRRKLRSLCWETMFGQELVKLTVMDLVLTILSTLMVDFIRAVFVRVMNNCWCWDLEKKFPQYGDFKIAENILHLVNNQGMVWMGMFFSPGLPLINLIKLIVMMYLRSWAVLTCNVPHEVVFRASRSNNFYLALLLTMLFLCVLPVSYAIVWVEPSWHCGPFSNHDKIYHLFTNSTKRAIPSKVIHRALDYIASPGIVIPLLMLLVLIIYYLVSLTNALREANNDLKIQLRRERTEERRKVFQMVDRKHRGGGSGDLIDSTPFHKWQKTLNVLPNSKGSGDQTSDTIKEDNGHTINGDIKTDAKRT